LTLSRQIAVGVAAGVGLGLLTGERTAPLQVAADAYVRLLQMTVLPYVVVSLIAGLGSLSAATARRILGRVGLILVALWGLAITLAFLLPLSFPRWETASFYSNVRPAAAEGFDFLGLYIPTNPFAALANNVVPAVVLFSVVIGLALIRVNGKESLLGPLHALARAIGEVNHFVMRLAPYGLFATAASLAGSMRMAELQRVEVYLAAYAAVALLLVLWVLPGLVSVLTPARYGEVVGPARDAVITAALTGSLFAVLPALGEVARGVLKRHAPDRPEAVDAPDIIVPASFNFPHSAKLLSLSFIPFAAWYSEAPLQGPADYLRLAGAGLLSFFGSLNAAVPFLLDLFHLPQDAFHLFQATSVINSRLGSAVAAMHTLVLAVLGGFAMSGLLRVDRRRLLRYLAISAGLTFTALGSLRLLFGVALAQPYDRDQVLASMERISTGVPATVHRQPLPPFEEGAPALERIAARKLLRVGYRADNPPYTFFNAAGDLVGLDVEMAHQLARDLGVGLELAPLGGVRLADERLLESCCDVVMSGVLITGPRAARLAFTAPYFEEHLGFLVSDHDRARFATREALRAAGRVRVLALAEGPELDRLREYAPEADIRRVDSIEPYLRFFVGDRSEGDALLMPAERGATWSLRHPELTAVVPDPPLMTLPLGYVVGRGDERLRLFLNAWLDLKKRDGTIEELTGYWVYGHDAEPRRPRWNLLDDVLRR
jgi:Na+/H+-dicarboxylate symporter/ABC-type amino acid transport substrate-binding protein